MRKQKPGAMNQPNEENRLSSIQTSSFPVTSEVHTSLDRMPNTPHESSIIEQVESSRGHFAHLNDHSYSQSSGTTDSGTYLEENERNRNRSRVQMVTSGVVTVTNVISSSTFPGNDCEDIQSLEFEADEDEEESVEEPISSADIQNNNNNNNNDICHKIERSVNTIRIQVNYGDIPSGTSDNNST